MFSFSWSDLSYHITFSFDNAVIVWPVLAIISDLEPLSSIIAPKYLNFSTILSVSLFIFISDVKLPSELVIIWVFVALISIPYLRDVLSIFFIRLDSSDSLPASPSMSSANLRFVIILPPIFTVPIWFSNASFIICSSMMLKSVGDSKQPCLTPVVVWNHSPIFPSE